MNEMTEEYRSRPFHHYRKTVCWCCYTPINNGDYPECPACGWIICPECGACEQYGCFGVLKGGKEVYEDFRLKWFKIPEELRPPVTTWLQNMDEEEFQKTLQTARTRREKTIEAAEAEHLAAVKAEQLAKETADKAERQRVEDLWVRVQQGPEVVSETFGKGYVISVSEQGKYRYLSVSFNQNGNEEKIISFVFPAAFDKGFLKFTDIE